MRNAQMRWVGTGMELEKWGSGSFMISTKHGTCHSLDAREARHHGGMPHVADLGLTNAQLATTIRCKGTKSSYTQLHMGRGTDCPAGNRSRRGGQSSMNSVHYLQMQTALHLD